MDVLDRILEEFDTIPSWLVLAILVILLIDKVSPGASKLGQLIGNIVRLSRRLFRLPQSDDQKQWLRSHRMFADAIASRIQALNVSEDWRDNRYAELDVEVEAEGRQRFVGVFSRLIRPAEGLRREHSLTRALELSKERLILLEGDPGSGKSIALRHVAHVGLQRAIKSKHTRIVIPLYINLKELERGSKTIDAKLINDHVRSVLRRSATSDVDKFLDQEFDKGIKQGTWFFLFDSFDEIPEVLSSTRFDPIIESYAEAIYRFFELNACRGVVASRTFRSPRGFGWPTFRIVPLSQRRRRELIQKAVLNTEVEELLISQLPTAELGVRKLSSNPLFLGLVCEHMLEAQEFPTNAHTVFDSYVTRRLRKYEPYIRDRYGLGSEDVRILAQQLAFCMAAVTRLGLNPQRRDLQEAMAEEGFLHGEEVATAMDALEYIKLARSEGTVVPSSERSFTFAHRRFQEYFATRLVLADVTKVSSADLLEDGRWRETAVSILQLQPPSSIGLVLEEAERVLAEATATGNIPPLPHLETEDFDEPLEYAASTDTFSWPERVLDVLSILDSGLATKGVALPEGLGNHAARLLVFAWLHGYTYDRKWAVEVAGTAPEPVRTWLIRKAFQSRSGWVKEIAFTQISRFAKVPSDIASDIRRALMSLTAGGRLRKDKVSVVAPILRLDQAQDFLRVVRLLLLAPIVSIIAHVLFVLAVLLLSDAFQPNSTFIFFLIASISGFYLLRSAFSWNWGTPGGYEGLTRWVQGVPTSGAILLLEIRGMLWLLALSKVWEGGLAVSLAGAAMFAYLLSWDAALLVSAKNGRMTAVWQIPFGQIELVRTVYKAVISGFGNVTLKFSWSGALSAIGLWSIVVLVLGLLLLVGVWVWARWPAVIWVVGALYGVGMLALLGREFFAPMLGDLRWYGRWSRSATVRMNGAQLLKCLEQLRTPEGVVRVMRDIARRGLIVDDDETKRVLQDLVRFMEKKRAARLGKPLNGETSEGSFRENDWFSTTFREWITTKSEKEQTELASLARKRAGDKLVDELSRMVEQARSSGSMTVSS